MLQRVTGSARTRDGRAGLRRFLRATLAACAAAAAGCALTPTHVPAMGSAQITSDFGTYSIRRVGVVPFQALDSLRLNQHEVGAIETGFHSEFSAGTSFDLVPLRGTDLAEVLPPDPFRKGWYSPETIQTLRDRYRLDALLVGTITSRKVVSPQVLGMQLDLVSCETGATVWSSGIVLDASREDTRDAVAVWASQELGDDHGAAMTLLSPKRFARFAAYQLARLL